MARALLRGYLFFRVRVYDDHLDETRWGFFTYGAALRFKHLLIDDQVIPDRGHLVVLEGYHVLKGWQPHAVNMKNLRPRAA